METSCQQAQQGRFAVTIAADDADTVALVDAQAQRVEDHAGRELEMQGLGPKQVRHRSMLPALPAHPAGPLCRLPWQDAGDSEDSRRR